MSTSHPIDVFAWDEQRARSIEEHVDTQAGTAPLREGRRELVGDRPLLEDVLHQRDRAAGLPDRGEHGGEELLAILEELDAIAGQDGRAGVGLDGRIEGRLAQGDLGQFARRDDRRASGQHCQAHHDWDQAMHPDQATHALQISKRRAIGYIRAQGGT